MDGLRFVLGKLWPVRNALETYKRKYHVLLWCGHFHSDANASINPFVGYSEEARRFWR